MQPYTGASPGQKCGVDRNGERGAYNGSLEAERPHPTPPSCKNSWDLYQFQERPLALGSLQYIYETEKAIVYVKNC